MKCTSTKGPSHLHPLSSHCCNQVDVHYLPWIRLLIAHRAPDKSGSVACRGLPHLFLDIIVPSPTCIISRSESKKSFLFFCPGTTRRWRCSLKITSFMCTFDLRAIRTRPVSSSGCYILLQARLVDGHGVACGNMYFSGLRGLLSFTVFLNNTLMTCIEDVVISLGQVCIRARA